MDADSKCQMYFLNLLDHLNDSNISDNSVKFYRELFIINNCDHVNDLHKIRAEYKNFIDKDSHNRILNYEQDSTDIERCNQTVFHLNYETQDILKKNISWRNYIFRNF
jgi:hypothetical protein